MDAHQAGIATPAQDRLAFASMNVIDGVATAATSATLLSDWTVAAERMTRGQLVGDDTDLDDPPLDTGEAIGSPVSATHHHPRATARRSSTTRFRSGPEEARRSLTDLPPLPNENLDPDSSGGDLCIQACSDDPLVAFHAVRNLARLGMGVVDYNWMELGFGRTSTTSTARGHAAQPARLQGRHPQHQGRADRSDGRLRLGRRRNGPAVDARRQLPGGPADPMFLENWDRDYLGDQQNVIGRAKVTGAPLTGRERVHHPRLHGR